MLMIKSQRYIVITSLQENMVACIMNPVSPNHFYFILLLYCSRHLLSKNVKYSVVLAVLYHRLLVEQNKTFKDITLGSGKL